MEDFRAVLDDCLAAEASFFSRFFMVKSKQKGSPAGDDIAKGQTAGIAPAAMARLFPSPALLAVLSVVMLHPDQDFYQSEIAARAGYSLLQVQRALARIEQAGLISKKYRGRRASYAVERQHPTFEDFRRILIKTVGLREPLLTALEPLSNQIQLAFVFGSMVSGTESASSDIDLLIIGQISSRKLSGLLGSVARDLGREINPVVYPQGEFRQKYQAKNRFVHELVASPKIWLIGSENDLGKVVA